MGQKIADQVAATMGSWPFIIVQTGILFVWIVLNVTAFVQKWDPYPFILLNLALSFQAAYAAPFIMMSQNRQQDIDRKEAENDHQINIKAELEIELLHQKIDELREKEVMMLTQAVSRSDRASHKRPESEVLEARIDERESIWTRRRSQIRSGLHIPHPHIAARKQQACSYNSQGTYWI